MEGSYCLPMMALVGSTVVTGAMSFANKGKMTEFQNTLNQAQLAVWEKIKTERTRIFVVASIIGLIVGIMLKFNLCLSISAALFTQTMVYKLWPKSNYIMDYLQSPDQGRAWMRMTNNMSLFGDVGMIVGIVGYIILTSKINV